MPASRPARGRVSPSSAAAASRCCTIPERQSDIPGHQGEDQAAFKADKSLDVVLGLARTSLIPAPRRRSEGHEGRDVRRGGSIRRSRPVGYLSDRSAAVSAGYLPASSRRCSDEPEHGRKTGLRPSRTRDHQQGERVERSRARPKGTRLEGAGGRPSRAAHPRHHGPGGASLPSQSRTSASWRTGPLARLPCVPTSAHCSARRSLPRLSCYSPAASTGWATRASRELSARRRSSGTSTCRSPLLMIGGEFDLSAA